MENEDKILEKIEDLATSVKSGFDSIDEKIEALDTKVSTLPTKSYLDDKISDLKGDLISKLRKEDAKVEFIVGLMQSRKIFTDSDVEIIKREFEVFPKLN